MNTGSQDKASIGNFISGGTLTFVNCEFRHNKSSIRMGLFDILGDHVYLSFENSVFSRNSYLPFSLSSFQNDDSTEYSSLINIRGGGKLKLNKVCFLFNEVKFGPVISIHTFLLDSVDDMIMSDHLLVHDSTYGNGNYVTSQEQLGNGVTVLDDGSTVKNHNITCDSGMLLVNYNSLNDDSINRALSHVCIPFTSSQCETHH